jgi:hypothetical protein
LQRESTLSFLPLIIPSSLPGSTKGKKAKNTAAPTSNAPAPILESETWTPFLTVECRGLETVGFEWEVRPRLSGQHTVPRSCCCLSG